jgi:hypothetical protein
MTPQAHSEYCTARQDSNDEETKTTYHFQERDASFGMDAEMMRSRRIFEPLNPYLSATDPMVRFSDLTQVAEGQSGPVYAARAKDASNSISGSSNPSSARFGALVAVKTIKIKEESDGAPAPRVVALAEEMRVMKDVQHEHILTSAGLFVNGDTLWIEMELMERSLADMLPLIDEGLIVAEPEVARFASDVRSSVSTQRFTTTLTCSCSDTIWPRLSGDHAYRPSRCSLG